MASNKGIIIAIRPEAGEEPRKLTKVVGYGSQGFAVLMPYHKARSGWVGKMPVDYNKMGGVWIPFGDMIGFTAEDRVKLSYHRDGFAQFSGEVQGKIISGRDPSTGEPKGVGLMTQPLTDPILTGPSFGVTAWGVEDFEKLQPTDDVLVFDSEDMYFRNCTLSTANGWVLEVFVFRMRARYLTNLVQHYYDEAFAKHGNSISFCYCASEGSGGGGPRKSRISAPLP